MALSGHLSRRGNSPGITLWCFNFRKKNIYPSHSEMFGARQTFLRKNIIEGPFASIEQYLDIQFNLLREDFITSLREGFQKYLSGQGNHNIDIYENVTIFSTLVHRHEEMKIKLDPRSKIRNLEDSKKFLNGSLLIFTRDNFKTSFLAKVVHRHRADFEKNVILIEFVEKNQSGHYFTMAECRSFFEPYFQVLKVLKHMDIDEFPMEKYIIHLDTQKKLPRYLSRPFHYQVSGCRFKVTDWSSKFPSKITGLNDSQVQAFRAALSQELTVIQGPPGTGKTYLGLKIVETLLKNSNFWYRKSPILVVSHKNHALDQFLEGLIKITRNVVRVGGQSKSNVLEKYNLSHLVEEDGELEDLFNCLFLDDRLCRRKRDDLEVLQEALVVGMTTTAAARMRETLEQLACPIVIVEEAAEVLEAHVIAALSRKCEHLILLGDHLQLQPNTSDREIGQKYHLGVSLFERMVNNGIHCHKLNIQHRMRPQISKILQTTTYPFLEDHPSVFNKPPILGVDHNVFFLNHNHSEETINGTSKKNDHEAKFVVAFAKYLIQNGYKSSDVTILTTYAGQVRQIKAEIRLLKDREWLSNVKVSTLDAFQGQESEIIILSLVRSVEIGFIAGENRICVAMSRAKNGFYMIGNMTLFSTSSKLWRTIHQCLSTDRAIGHSLTLRCQQHPGTVTQVASAADFRKVPCGGCLITCKDGTFPCGHKCPLTCHVLQHDMYSLYYRCSEICKRSICKIHKSELCSKRCYELCEECTVKTLKKVECGHAAFVECSVSACSRCNSDSNESDTE